MIVSWVTMSKVEPSQVAYGLDPSNLANVVTGPNATVFKDGGDEHRTMYIHAVKLTDLEYGMQYCKLWI